MNNKEAISNLEDIRKVLYEVFPMTEDDKEQALDLAIKALEDTPTGKWVDTGDMAEYWAEEYQCSICGAKDHWHKYCPNCGARMETENEC